MTKDFWFGVTLGWLSLLVFEIGYSSYIYWSLLKEVLK